MKPQERNRNRRRDHTQSARRVPAFTFFWGSALSSVRNRKCASFLAPVGASTCAFPLLTGPSTHTVHWTLFVSAPRQGPFSSVRNRKCASFLAPIGASTCAFPLLTGLSTRIVHWTLLVSAPLEPVKWLVFFRKRFFVVKTYLGRNGAPPPFR